MITPPVLSVSQVEDYDSEQLGGCPRRWWFERVQGHRPESTAAHEDGHQGHALLAHYLSTGDRPGRVRLGKAVNAVIDSGILPAPGPDLQVEQRFSGQPHRDAHGQWVPLDVHRTLRHAGHPWEGFIDLRWRSGSTVTVWDHKFSSDIHARALPAERLIRTVQMPIYALDSFRAWPDATTVNLVHLYVSRRGVESFVRQQLVTAEQVIERAEEISGLVREMDALRDVTIQDNVPFNRAACHTRTGCPHQFRCNAFRRRGTIMDMTEEEQRMFGMLSNETPERPVPAEVTKFDKRSDEDRTRAYSRQALEAAARGDVAGAERIQAEYEARSEKPPTPARGAEPLERPASGPVTTPADLNLDDIFEPPVASTPKPQPASPCEACGEVLTPENSSRLKTGDVKHIGCPAEARAPETVKLSPRAETETNGPRCENCPHPAHAGKSCEGKRGRGACRCGVAVESKPERPQPPPAAWPGGKPEHSAAELQALADEASHAADVDRDGAAVAAREHQRAADEAREPETEPQRLARLVRERAEALPGAKTHTLPSAIATGMREAAKLIENAAGGSRSEPSGSWSGTLAVNVTVELGPSTLAFLAGLVKR